MLRTPPQRCHVLITINGKQVLKAEADFHFSLGSGGVTVVIQAFLGLLPSSDVRLTREPVHCFPSSKTTTLEWDPEQRALVRNGTHTLSCCPCLCPWRRTLVSLAPFSRESGWGFRSRLRWWLLTATMNLTRAPEQRLSRD